MGWYVHIVVSFYCNKNDPVAALAAKHLPAVKSKRDDGMSEARWFLDALSKRTGENPGPKGGLSVWGMVGNHTKGLKFCEVLRPFWSELLSGKIEGGPSKLERILVIEEQEQANSATVYQVGMDDGELNISVFERMPFAWRVF